MPRGVYDSVKMACGGGTLDRPQFNHSLSSIRKPHLLSSPEVFPPICIPGPINQFLRDYQRDGVQFLYDQYRRRVGGLLCDDMGLGKTVQVITFICAILRKTCTKTDVLLTGPKQAVSEGAVLILCPCSLLYNWVTEIETWSHLKTGVYHRNKKDEVFDKVSRGRLDVVISTLETAKLKIDDINSIPWLAVFVDEVHALKNPESQITEALCHLKCHIRFGLTGTALQNKMNELWCILNWINPCCLGAWHEFQFQFEHPILQGQKFDCTKRELATAKEKQEQLGKILSKWMIRRTKLLIADQLPKKEEFIVFCPVTPLQGSIYSTILQTSEIIELVHAHQACLCGSGLSALKCCNKHENSRMLAIQGIYLSLLLKCANHIGLLLPSFLASDKQNEKTYQICQEVFCHYPEFFEMSSDASFLTLADPNYCGKMQILSKLLAQFHQESSKVIIFSESVRLLNILENYLVCRSFTYCRLDGSTKVEDRGSIVNKFNNDKSLFVFLISKKCGGVGLNVTGANRVIIFDPSWNPANDIQAEDRVFRIGQRHDVKVYRFISEGTIEEILYLRQVYKQQLANTAMEGSNERRYFTGVAGDNNRKGEIFGVLNLFQPLRCGPSLTENILKRADQESGFCISNIYSEVTFTSENFLEGATVLVHCGEKKAVVGNCPAEEHIRNHALRDLDCNSQHPANSLDVLKQSIADDSTTECVKVELAANLKMSDVPNDEDSLLSQNLLHKKIKTECTEMNEPLTLFDFGESKQHFSQDQKDISTCYSKKPLHQTPPNKNTKDAIGSIDDLFYVDEAIEVTQSQIALGSSSDCFLSLDNLFDL